MGTNMAETNLHKLMTSAENLELLDSIFVISRIIEVSVRVTCLSSSADNPFLDLDYSGYHKTSFNNYLQASLLTVSESFKIK